MVLQPIEYLRDLLFDLELNQFQKFFFTSLVC